MNIPESKPAADWASEWLGYNVGPEQKRLVEWIDEIKASAAAHARYKALTEAAEIVNQEELKICEPIRHLMTHLETRSQQAILALRDAKET